MNVFNKFNMHKLVAPGMYRKLLVFTFLLLFTFTSGLPVTPEPGYKPISPLQDAASLQSEPPTLDVASHGTSILSSQLKSSAQHAILDFPLSSGGKAHNPSGTQHKLSEITDVQNLSPSDFHWGEPVGLNNKADNHGQPWHNTGGSLSSGHIVDHGRVHGNQPVHGDRLLSGTGEQVLNNAGHNPGDIVSTGGNNQLEGPVDLSMIQAIPERVQSSLTAVADIPKVNENSASNTVGYTETGTGSKNSNTQHSHSDYSQGIIFEPLGMQPDVNANKGSIGQVPDPFASIMNVVGTPGSGQSVLPAVTENKTPEYSAPSATGTQGSGQSVLPAVTENNTPEYSAPSTGTISTGSETTGSASSNMADPILSEVVDPMLSMVGIQPVGTKGVVHIEPINIPGMVVPVDSANANPSYTHENNAGHASHMNTENVVSVGANYPGESIPVNPNNVIAGDPNHVHSVPLNLNNVNPADSTLFNVVPLNPNNAYPTDASYVNFIPLNPNNVNPADAGGANSIPVGSNSAYPGVASHVNAIPIDLNVYPAESNNVNSIPLGQNNVNTANVNSVHDVHQPAAIPIDSGIVVHADPHNAHGTYLDNTAPSGKNSNIPVDHGHLHGTHPDIGVHVESSKTSKVHPIHVHDIPSMSGVPVYPNNMGLPDQSIVHVDPTIAEPKTPLSGYIPLDPIDNPNSHASHTHDIHPTEGIPVNPNVISVDQSLGHAVYPVDPTHADPTNAVQNNPSQGQSNYPSNTIPATDPHVMHDRQHGVAIHADAHSASHVHTNHVHDVLPGNTLDYSNAASTNPSHGQASGVYPGEPAPVDLTKSGHVDHSHVHGVPVEPVVPVDPNTVVDASNTYGSHSSNAAITDPTGTYASNAVPIGSNVHVEPIHGQGIHPGETVPVHPDNAGTNYVQGNVVPIDSTNVVQVDPRQVHDKSPGAVVPGDVVSGSYVSATHQGDSVPVNPNIVATDYTSNTHGTSGGVPVDPTLVDHTHSSHPLSTDAYLASHNNVPVVNSKNKHDTHSAGKPHVYPNEAQANAIVDHTHSSHPLSTDAYLANQNNVAGVNSNSRHDIHSAGKPPVYPNEVQTSANVHPGESLPIDPSTVFPGGPTLIHSGASAQSGNIKDSLSKGGVADLHGSAYTGASNANHVHDSHSHATTYVEKQPLQPSGRAYTGASSANHVHDSHSHATTYVEKQPLQPSGRADPGQRLGDMIQAVPHTPADPVVDYSSSHDQGSSAGQTITMSSRDQAGSKIVQGKGKYSSGADAVDISGGNLGSAHAQFIDHWVRNPDAHLANIPGAIPLNKVPIESNAIIPPTLPPASVFAGQSQHGHHGHHDHHGGNLGNCKQTSGVVKDTAGKITHIVDPHDCKLLPVVDSHITGGHAIDPHNQELLLALESNSFVRNSQHTGSGSVGQTTASGYYQTTPSTYIAAESAAMSVTTPMPTPAYIAAPTTPKPVDVTRFSIRKIQKMFKLSRKEARKFRTLERKKKLKMKRLARKKAREELARKRKEARRLKRQKQLERLRKRKEARKLAKARAKARKEAKLRKQRQMRQYRRHRKGKAAKKTSGRRRNRKRTSRRSRKRTKSRRTRQRRQRKTKTKKQRQTG